MCNMDINCDSTAAAAADELALAGACTGKPRVSMEVILEETEDDLAAAAAARASLEACGAAAAAAGKPPAPASPSGNSAQNSGGGSVINYSNGPNMALAITSSFYGPSQKASGGAGSHSLSRCGSSAMTCDVSAGTSASGSPDPDSPVMQRPAKQQHGAHGPVRACPSTRSLNSASSCHSSWASFALPSSPSSDGLQKQAAEASAAGDSMMNEDASAACRTAQRCMKKAVRHPPAATAAAAGAAACKPPLAGKPASQAAPAQQAKPAAGSPACSAQGKPQGLGMPSVPLPTGLGALPQGMVWGMPMCPLVRAPGIVPPTNPSAGQAAAGMASMSMAPWGMCGMPMYGAMPPVPFMSSGYSSMMPAVNMAPYPAAPAAAAAAGYSLPAAGGSFMEASSFGQQQMWGQQAAEQQQQGGAQAASTAAAPTGAAVAAALNASFSAAALLGGGEGRAVEAAAAVAMDDDAFDFMLGDITAEDDMTDVCASVLDGDVLRMPAELSSEMLALQADMQQQAAAAAAGRCSFESSAAQRSRVSFDCSTASTCTAARASFEASQRCNSARVSFEVSCHNSRSNRVSFEVNCHNSSAAAPAAPGGVGACSAADLKNAASTPAQLLGSVSDLFAVACSGDSSHDSGLQRIDSCGMLADLQSFFAASGDSSCPQDCADSALADGSGLFLDPLDDMPVDGGMRKNDSFAELINASLPGLAN